jgi:predicted transcriptional regulator
MEKDILTLEEFEKNTIDILNNILTSGKKRTILMDGKAAIEIQKTDQVTSAERKLKELQEENESLKFILGVKKGLEDYKEGRLIDHEVIRDRFEKYLKKKKNNCPYCGQGNISFKTIKEVIFDTAGKEHKIDVLVGICDNCDDKVYPKESALMIERKIK